MYLGEMPRYPPGYQKGTSPGGEFWLLRPLVLAWTLLLHPLAQVAWCLLKRVSAVLEKMFLLPTLVPNERNGEAEGWQESAEQRIYSRSGANATPVTVQTSSCSFQVELELLAEHSEYFRALSASCMRETSEHRVILEHIPSAIFRSILEFIFHGEFYLHGEEQLLAGIEAGSYLLCSGYLQHCCHSLRGLMCPPTCQRYLQFSHLIACEEMLHVVHQYLSDGLLELASITRTLGNDEREGLVSMREQGTPELCMLRKESLGRDLSHSDFLCRLPLGGESWSRSSQFPFRADKWNVSVAVLWNYLFVIGGYRHKLKKGSEFRTASFRYNPILDRWDTTAPMIKRRRHFSMAVVGQHIFAIGGWYLDVLLAPDSSTRLYSTVERYDPWTDTWTFVASLPLTDFSFSVSLSHDLPLCAACSDFIYVLGSVQRTGEKLVLQYDTRSDTWLELLPTLTRTDCNMPCLYFLGGSDPLFLLGGNNEENVVITFSPGAQSWGKARRMAKCTLAGQGTSMNGTFFLPAPELNAILQVDLATLSAQTLPTPPRPVSYEALVILWYPPVGSERDWRECPKIHKER
ncbi:kelch repeat and BTB domain-containing protein 13-like [Ambystoma mexicanum]|uniref:kelch repeat and BTB domain-containing protein 13-like n=1 Tax=Ambystoma mexicanum TaxID=8296 RepID=UPI0037E942B1